MLEGHAIKSKLSTSVLYAVLALSMSACTMGHTPEPYLPLRSSLVAGETVTVKNNENIYAVARAHNVSMRDIIVLNNLKPPFALKGGQQLVMPINTTALASGVTKETSAVLPGSSIEQVDLPPLSSTTVSPAVPLVSQDNNFNSSVGPVAVERSPIEALNAPSPPLKNIATTVKQLPDANVAVTKPEPLLSQDPSSSLTPAVPTKPSEAVPLAPAIAPAVATTSVSTAASPLAMEWPLQGPVLSSFGDKGRGLVNDGVNIGAPKGAPVVAAARGTVVYAGNEMKGFGNLILIRHEKGCVTAYAHLDRMLVTKDTIVAEGDMIGTVGKTGNVASPQLHFEVRRDGKPIDPKSVIKG